MWKGQIPSWILQSGAILLKARSCTDSTEKKQGGARGDWATASYTLRISRVTWVWQRALCELPESQSNKMMQDSNGIPVSFE